VVVNLYSDIGGDGAGRGGKFENEVDVGEGEIELSNNIFGGDGAGRGGKFENDVDVGEIELSNNTFGGDGAGRGGKLENVGIL
jgi:hypothetical protein